MMDRSKVKAIVEREIGPLMGRLGIPHWKVTVSYGLRGESDDATINAQCTRLVDYNRALIEFDPDALDDEAEVLRVLRHELFHILLSPFDVYTGAVRRLDLGSAEAVLDQVQTHATEQAVINLERMYSELVG